MQCEFPKKQVTSNLTTYLPLTFWKISPQKIAYLYFPYYAIYIIAPSPWRFFKKRRFYILVSFYYFLANKIQYDKNCVRSTCLYRKIVSSQYLIAPREKRQVCSRICFSLHWLFSLLKKSEFYAESLPWRISDRPQCRQTWPTDPGHTGLQIMETYSRIIIHINIFMYPDLVFEKAGIQLQFFEWSKTTDPDQDLV